MVPVAKNDVEKLDEEKEIQAGKKHEEKIEQMAKNNWHGGGDQVQLQLHVSSPSMSPNDQQRHHNHHRRPRRHPPHRLPLDLRLLLDPVFLLVAILFSVATPCTYGVWTYLPSLAASRGLTAEEGAYLTMINHVASALAPPVCGVLASGDAVRPRIPALTVGILLINAIVEAAVFLFLADQGKRALWDKTRSF